MGLICGITGFILITAATALEALETLWHGGILRFEPHHNSALIRSIKIQKSTLRNRQYAAGSKVGGLPGSGEFRDGAGHVGAPGQFTLPDQRN